MKKSIYHMTFIWLVLLMQIGNVALGQPTNPCSGNWTGNFMQDFKAIIRLDLDDEENMSGNILMFASNNQIQDDELTQIKIDGNALSFFIPAKETHYSGIFNPEITKLTGHFVFPDGSQHPLTVKKENQSQALAPEPTASYQSWKQKKYSKNALLEDLKVLSTKLKENHPSLYAYTSEGMMEKLVLQVMENIREGMTIVDYFNVIIPVTDVVKCSHTGMRLPSKYMDLMQEYDSFFPLRLFFTNRKAYYVPASGEQRTDIDSRSEIESINGIPVPKIIDQVLAYIPAEGSNQTAKYNGLNRNFSTYFQLISTSEYYDIEYINGGQKHLTTIAGSSGESLFSGDLAIIPLDFYLDQMNDVGFIKIKAFAFPDIESFIHLTDSLFKVLNYEKAADLVIDLRDNSGGHPIYAAQLFSYLTDHEFTYFKANPDVTEFEPLYHPMQPNPLRFNGNIYVLVNGGCLSTTGHFISLLKYHTNAKFIGEQPGSTFSCNDRSIGISLPNTGIEVNIPTTTFETAVTDFKSDRSFYLDYKIDQKIDDLVAGRDASMEFLLDMIRKNN